jgi:hypothetical protein
MSRSLEKAVQDVAKLDASASEVGKQHRDKGVKTWFITKFDATADQMKEVRKSASSVTALSFSAFQARLIDVGTYLDCRLKHRFGSIDHPIAGQSADEIKYIPIPILGSASPEEWSVAKIGNGLLAGERFTLIGDYGIGKSMTLREVFRFLRSRYLHRHTPSFPIYINLREHHGQTNPAEILERHARDVGYSNPSHIVRAWKAGYATLILDGFDEVASFGLQGEWKRLREARRQAMTGVRRMIRETPPNSGVAVAGRQSFFDSDKERNEALGDAHFHSLLLHEFTEEQVTTFFSQVGFIGQIPSWLPSRPLLLSTIFWLYNREHGSDAQGTYASLPQNPSEGWAALLDVLSEREARIEAGVSGETIRRILETLATKARATSSGLGPLTTTEITDSFQTIAGIPPSSQALSVLQRLPGLSVVPNTDDGQRCFIDEDFVDALGAGDVYLVLTDPFSAADTEDILSVRKSLGPVGSGILTGQLTTAAFERKRIVQVFKELERKDWLTGAAADLFLYGHQGGFISGLDLHMKNIEIQELTLAEGDADLSKVRFDGCMFQRLALSYRVKRGLLPIFHKCLIEYLHGVQVRTDLPSDHFDACEIDRFVDDAETNAAILRSEMPGQLRVLLTVFRKLFVQSLSGRQAAALKRGLDPKDQGTVDSVLEELLKQSVVTKYKAGGDLVILPVRRMKRRVMAILASPLSSQDPLAVLFQNK